MPPVLRMPCRQRSVMPKMPPQSYRSYLIRSPRDVTVKTACEQAGCLAWRHGWESPVDERVSCGGDPSAGTCAWVRAGQRACGACQGRVIRRSGRTFTERKTADGITVFRFESGQRCFREHRTRPERYLMVGGDWRGNPRGERRVHKTPADWVEDSGEHLQKLVTAIERG